MVVLILCIVVFLTVNDYLYTKDNYEKDLSILQLQSEQNIKEAMKLKDATWKIFDDDNNDRMKKGLEHLVREYEFSGRDPARMDLTKIQSVIGTDLDIYFINESGMIEFTTYSPELGLDFKTVPYFYEYLTKVRNSEGFFPDRVVHELLGTGQFRKYCYMPTPDHRYVIELGLAGSAFQEINKRLVDQQDIRRIVAVNPYIEKIRVFNVMGRASDDNSKPEDIVGGYIKTVAATRQSMDIPDPGQSKMIRYLFVELKTDQYGSDPSRVIEITYNTGMIQDALNNLLLYHLLVGILALCIGCGGAFVLSRYLTRPIHEIVDDVNTIAKGDLDHRIGHTESLEFEVLEQNINTMVDTIQDSLIELNNGKLLQQNIIDHLPVAVAMKEVESGKYVYWNKVSEKFYGLSATEVIGRTDPEIFSEEQVIYKQNEERAAILKGRGISCITMLDALFTGRIINKIHVPIFDSEGTLRYLLVIVENLDNENLNVKLDLLFSVTRRDILDHLSIIISYLERAQLRATPESMQIFFQKTLESVEAIQNQLEFVRALQAIGIGSPKWQSVRTAFDGGIHLLPKHNHIDIRFEMEDIEIYADPFLPRIFYSLLNNSLIYGGDSLTTIRLRSLHTPEKILLVYEDNGAGVPFEDKEKIFEFADGSGMGSNLYLIRELLGFTGITIEETGDPESGLRFEISVPKGAYRPIGPENT